MKPSEWWAILMDFQIPFACGIVLGVLGGVDAPFLPWAWRSLAIILVGVIWKHIILYVLKEGEQ